MRFNVKTNGNRDFVRIFLLLFMALSLSSCNAFVYGLWQPELSAAGWIDLSSDGDTKKIVLQRIDAERSCDAVNSAIRQFGYPDFYKTVDLFDRYYVYVPEGVVYRFPDSHHSSSCSAYSYTDGNYPDAVPSWLVVRMTASASGEKGGSTFVRPPDV